MKFNIKTLHIAIIIIGTIILLSTSFHTNLWFDEAYTVGLVNHNFYDMFTISITDVHPFLYYFILKIFSLIFGNSIIALRIFSVIGICLLSIFGYTHIRKEFGDKVGLYFSFLSCFLPIILGYVAEIRMYTWVALFVSLAGFYCYKVYKYNDKNSWVLFGIFSILSAYMQYFGLLTVVTMNLILLIYAIKHKEYIKPWIKTAIFEILLYIPGFIIFLIQAIRVSHGFWIQIKYPDILFEIIAFHFTDNIKTIIPLLFAFTLYFILFFINYKEIKKDKENAIIPIISIGIYIFIIVLTLILSLVQDIFTTRYLMPMLGILIFFIAYNLSKIKNKWLPILISFIILALFFFDYYLVINKNYDSSNTKFEKVIEDNIAKDDIFVYSDITLGSIAAVKYPENKQYFYNKDNWSVEEAYKAFGKNFKCINSLDEIPEDYNRIWIIDNPNKELSSSYKNNENFKEIIQDEEFNLPYKNFTFVISLFQK